MQRVHLFIGKDTIHTTPEHPFFVPQQEEEIYASTDGFTPSLLGQGSWVLAKNLRKGTKVFLFSTLLATVDSTFAQDTICTVYNFEVERTHNYFVGNESILVHNTCIDELGKFLNSSEADDVLSSEMKKRYQRLYDDAKNTGATNLAKYEERAKVTLETVKWKKRIISLLDHSLHEEFKGSNIVFGSYRFKGMTKEVKFVSISGKNETAFFKNSGIKEIDGHIIVPTPSKNLADRHFPFTDPTKRQDAEAKFIEFLCDEIEKTNKSIKLSPNILKSEIKDLEINIAFSSEMHPCSSCSSIIKDFDNALFGSGTNNKLNWRYGTDYP